MRRCLHNCQRLNLEKISAILTHAIFNKCQNSLCLFICICITMPSASLMFSRVFSIFGNNSIIFCLLCRILLGKKEHNVFTQIHIANTPYITSICRFSLKLLSQSWMHTIVLNVSVCCNSVRLRLRFPFTRTKDFSSNLFQHDNVYRNMSMMPWSAEVEVEELYLPAQSPKPKPSEHLQGEPSLRPSTTSVLNGQISINVKCFIFIKIYLTIKMFCHPYEKLKISFPKTYKCFSS